MRTRRRAGLACMAPKLAPAAPLASVSGSAAAVVPGRPCGTSLLRRSQPHALCTRARCARSQQHAQCIPQLISAAAAAVLLQLRDSRSGCSCCACACRQAGAMLSVIAECLNAAGQTCRKQHPKQTNAKPQGRQQVSVAQSGQRLCSECAAPCKLLCACRQVNAAIACRGALTSARIHAYGTGMLFQPHQAVMHSLLPACG